MSSRARRGGVELAIVAPAILIALLALCIGAALVALAVLSRPPASIPEAGILFTVRSGESASEVALRLEREGLIRSRFVFRAFARLFGAEGGLKAGVYLIKPGTDARAVLTLLVSGKQALARVTVPEGASLSRVASILEDAGVVKAEEFLAASRDLALLSELKIPSLSLEGYLFPDTYFLPRGYSASDVARTMLKTFRARIADIPEAASLSATELHAKVTLASIVEREYRIADEAPLMASVFYNRLKIGMALQSCATVVYVITEKLGKPHPERLFDRDIAIPDPYNTYLNRGLPPGPIANPGITALRAALRPATTKYLYFRLVDEAKGRHHFSETLEEHIGAGALLVKRVGGK